MKDIKEMSSNSIRNMMNNAGEKMKNPSTQSEKE